MNKSILNVVGVVAVAAALFVGCIDEGNPTNEGDGGESRLSINGEQVYVYDVSNIISSQGLENSLKSNHTVSFTNFGSWTVSGNKNLADFFKDPIAKMTNGKLTIDIGKPIGGLIPLIDLDDDQDMQISDRTTKIFSLTGFRGAGDNNVLVSNNSLVSIDVGSSIVDIDIPAGKTDIDIKNAMFYYVDKDVTIIQKGVSLSLRKGWNKVTTQRISSDTSVPVNISNSDDIRWFIYNPLND